MERSDSGISRALKNLLISWFKPESAGGYLQHGWIHADSKLHAGFGHPEGNIDAYAVMKLCHEDEYARRFRAWLDQAIYGNDLPLDLYSWRSLAYGKDGAVFLSVPENDTRFRKTVTFHGREITGFFHAPDANINNIWLDGTGHMACAFFSTGNYGKGCYYANQLDRFIIEKVINGKKSENRSIFRECFGRL